MYDFEKGKKCALISRTSQHAKTRVELQCPFCEEIFTAFIWSLSANGKKCPECGAIHYRTGDAYPVKEESHD